MYKYFFLFAFGAALLSSAQKVQISWEKPIIMDYGTEKKTFPKFSNEGYDADGSNIFINVKEKSNGGIYRIANLYWEAVPEKELYDLSYHALPDRDITGVSYYTIPGENVEYYNAKVASFKNTNGKIYRLASFEIVPDDSNTARGARMMTEKIGTTENPLKTGTFYKIKVDKSGVFKITKKFLSDNGINPTNINPKNFRIYGNGGLMLPENKNDPRYGALQENAIQVVGEEDGRWDEGDYALFYAQGPHGYDVFRRDSLTDWRTDQSRHLQNIYEDSAYYFMNYDIGPHKTIEDENESLPNELLTRYDEYQFIDEDKNNLLKLGRVWVADPFPTEKTISFKTKTPIKTTDEIYYRTSVVGYNAQGNSVKFELNGGQTVTLDISKAAESYVKINNQRTVTGISGNNIDIKLTPNSTVNPNGIFYFDYAEVQYKEDLIFNDSQMNFRDYSIMANSTGLYGFSMAGAANAEQVWDVSDITNVRRKVNQSKNNTVFNFGYRPDGKFGNEFVAFKNAAAFTPTFVGRVENQDLASLQNIDYLIITQPEMFSEAKRLADFHTKKDGFKVEIVNINQIYNEYSSGSKDITGIRDFVSDLHYNRGGMKYLLLLGDSSYDYKNKTAGNDNIISSYQSEESGSFASSFITDDYFVQVGPKQSQLVHGNLPNFPVGRIPASNVAEAKTMIDKILAYHNALPGQSSPFGEWRLKLDFIADDDADNKVPFHNTLNDALVSNFESGKRSEYNVRKLYLDAFTPEISAGGQRYPAVNQAINSDINNSLYMFYFGHGGINSWAQERILTTEEIKNFNNFNRAYSRFPFVSTITCEFTLWDDPAIKSAGEQFIKHKTGGAATMITSSRAISVTYGEEMVNLMTENLFDLDTGDFRSLGDAHLSAKKLKGADSNHLRVNFLGDPAMKLSRPKPNLTIDKIESPKMDTLRALDFVKISGQIKKADRSLDSSFNGRVVINIFDKKLTKSTKNNDGNLAPTLPYQEEGSAIVKTSGKAINGEYTVEFYVPKDINYTKGTGRILAYADNFEEAKSNAYDVFHNQDVTVGGINETPLNDSQPPKIRLYMNNTNFADGGITNQSPLLLACVTDDTGINSTGAGIGHDITVILDGQVMNTIALNDFFSAGKTNGCSAEGMKEYQMGSVAYPFRNLSPGQHQLVFKVWDINNNSSTASLNFIVKSDADQKLVLNKLLNWPNPFTDKTYIHFEHNCDDILDVNVQIYTITGKLVRTISQPVISEPFLQGYRTPRQAIEWDGKDDYGATVGKGTYIFKVYARSQNQDRCKGGATATEKMVLLK